MGLHLRNQSSLSYEGEETTKLAHMYRKLRRTSQLIDKQERERNWSAHVWWMQSKGRKDPVEGEEYIKMY